MSVSEVWTKLHPLQCLKKIHSTPLGPPKIPPLPNFHNPHSPPPLVLNGVFWLRIPIDIGLDYSTNWNSSTLEREKTSGSSNMKWWQFYQHIFTQIWSFEWLSLHGITHERTWQSCKCLVNKHGRYETGKWRKRKKIDLPGLEKEICLTSEGNRSEMY